MSSSHELYRLSFSQHPGYLFAHIRAETIDEKIARAYLRDVAAKVNELSVSRLLLLREIPVILPDSELFFVMQEFLDLFGSTKVAFVNPFPAISQNMEILVIMGRNRGGDYALCNNIPAAERWLLRPSSSFDYRRPSRV